MNLIEVTDNSLKTDEKNILITSILSAEIFESSCNLKLADEKDEIYIFFKDEKEKNDIKEKLDVHFENRATLRRMTLWEHITNDFINALILGLNLCLILSYAAQYRSIRVPSFLYPIVLLGKLLPEYILQMLIGICSIVSIYKIFKSFIKKREVIVFDSK